MTQHSHFWAYTRENHNPRRHMPHLPHSHTIYSTGTWKQPKCPSAEEWVKQMWYVYTMEYYPAIKGTKLSHLYRHGWTERLSYRRK